MGMSGWLGWWLDGWMNECVCMCERGELNPSCQQEGSSKFQDHGSSLPDQNSKRSKTRPPYDPDPQLAIQIPQHSTRTQTKTNFVLRNA